MLNVLNLEIDSYINQMSKYRSFSVAQLAACLSHDLKHYKHVAIGIATMTVYDSQPNQASRFIILSN